MTPVRGSGGPASVLKRPAGPADGLQRPGRDSRPRSPVLAERPPLGRNWGGGLGGWPLLSSLTFDPIHLN